MKKFLFKVGLSALILPCLISAKEPIIYQPMNNFQRYYCAEECTFQETLWIGSHNSYSGPSGLYNILRYTSAPELDFHYDDGQYLVGHEFPGHEVKLGEGNPNSLELSDWLSIIDRWSRQHPGHEPITVFLDMKEGLIDEEGFSPAAFNQYLLDSFSDGKLYYTEDFDLSHYYYKDKISIVLMGQDSLFRHVSDTKQALYDYPDRIYYVAVRPNQDEFDSPYVNLSIKDEPIEGKINRLYIKNYESLEQATGLTFLAIDLR